jgi:hypothetical protein
LPPVDYRLPNPAFARCDPDIRSPAIAPHSPLQAIAPLPSESVHIIIEII